MTFQHFPTLATAFLNFAGLSKNVQKVLQGPCKSPTRALQGFRKDLAKKLSQEFIFAFGFLEGCAVSLVGVFVEGLAEFLWIQSVEKLSKSFH